jgi:hypothetical protein
MILTKTVIFFSYLKKLSTSRYCSFRTHRSKMSVLFHLSSNRYCYVLFAVSGVTSCFASVLPHTSSYRYCTMDHHIGTVPCILISVLSSIPHIGTVPCFLLPVPSHASSHRCHHILPHIRAVSPFLVKGVKAHEITLLQTLLLQLQ